MLITENLDMKIWISSQKDPNNVTFKNDLQTRLEALYPQLQGLKYVFQCERTKPEKHFFPSGYSDNPEPASAEVGSSPDVWVYRWVGNYSSISLILSMSTSEMR